MGAAHNRAALVRRLRFPYVVVQRKRTDCPLAYGYESPLVKATPATPHAPAQPAASSSQVPAPHFLAPVEDSAANGNGQGCPTLATSSGSRLEQALATARGHLLGRQQADGHWCGELEGDSILQSEYILLMAWLDRLDEPDVRGAARYLLQQQMPGGGWNQYPGGPVDISASVKAYFALKLTGHDAGSSAMRRARSAILDHGGADAVNSFTRFYLALLGQIHFDHCPAVPPEAVLLPAWSPLNMYRVSAWSRTIFVPLAIVWAFRPRRELSAERGIGELFHRPPDQWPPLRCPGLDAAPGGWGWDRFFRFVDRALKWCQRWRITPLRRRALRSAETWMVERFADSDGLGAIFPPIIWSIVALRCLGYADSSPEVRECHQQLSGLMIRERDTVRLQPCKSPVWDTALSLRALAASNSLAATRPNSAADSAVNSINSAHNTVADSGPAVRRGVAWLLDREVRRPGDWSVNVRAEPAGWFFEYRNAFYPDVDDTIMVLMALRENAPPATPR
ncbi:MAG: hypothetical protein J5I93_01490, partial [Pirellulaceae bacterium]|nr:hypothetical protein [Pirellulaceae bacterium]